MLSIYVIKIPTFIPYIMVFETVTSILKNIMGTFVRIKYKLKNEYYNSCMSLILPHETLVHAKLNISYLILDT
jgi:hypothetical protein